MNKPEQIQSLTDRYGKQPSIPIECGGLLVCDHEFTVTQGHRVQGQQMKSCTKCGYTRPVDRYWWENNTE